MARRLDRPNSIPVGPLMCRVHRPPIKSNPLWAWRITTRGRGFVTLDSGRWTEDEVQRRAAEIIANGHHLRLPSPGVVQSGKPDTVGDLLAAYAEATYVGSTRHEDSTLRNVKRCMKTLRRLVGDVPLAALSRDNIARYVRDRESEGRASSTIIKEWVILAQAWKYGRESLWVTGDLPGHGIEIVKPVYNHHTPGDNDVRLVQQYLVRKAESRRNGAHWPWLALVIADETGARVGEIEKLRVRDFDPKGFLTLHGKRTKRNPTGIRRIRIDEPLVNTLLEWLMRRGRPGPEEALLGVRGKLIRSRGRDKLADACHELGLKRFSWHGLRRRVVRRFRRDGVSVKAAAEYFGHSPLVMLRIYDEIDEEDMQDEMEKVWRKRRIVSND